MTPPIRPIPGGSVAFGATLFTDFLYSGSLLPDMNNGLLTLSRLAPNTSYSRSFGGSCNATGPRITRIIDGTVTLSYDATLALPSAPETGGARRVLRGASP